MNQHILNVKRRTSLVTVFTLILSVQLGFIAYSGELKSRVPPDQLQEAQSLKNPYSVTKEFVDKGRILYEGRAFCSVCHGRDGQGLPVGPDYDSSSQPLPTNFTDGAWQTARSDGEIFWILKNGSHGTDMAAFMPQYVSEKEAWQLVTYLRSFQGA
ncbi:c-type cytochrome [Candidatus Nitrospira salsa]|nr:MAG: hypothetical protein NPIRA04_01790 [Nitrospirales bacterium]